MDDKISIITPAYNCAEFLPSTIKSVLNQSYQNWEMIIVDDCSKDNTYEVALEYLKRDSRIKVLRNKENLGVGATRHEAMKIATGKYFAFLDSDDVWARTKLEKQHKFMKDNDYPMSHTSYVFMNEEGDIKNNGFVRVDKEIGLKEYMKTTQIGLSTAMVDVTKTGIPPFPKDRVLGEDAVTWMKMFNSGIKSYGLDDFLSMYRIREKQISANKIKMARETLKRYMKEKEMPVPERLYCWSCYSVNAAVKRLKKTEDIKLDETILKDLKDLKNSR